MIAPESLAEFRRWAETMAPAEFIHARTALLILADLEVTREFALRLADRIHLAHEVIGKRAERRFWNGTEVDYCIL